MILLVQFASIIFGSNGFRVRARAIQEALTILVTLYDPDLVQLRYSAKQPLKFVEHLSPT